METYIYFLNIYITKELYISAQLSVDTHIENQFSMSKFGQRWIYGVLQCDLNMCYWQLNYNKMYIIIILHILNYASEITIRSVTQYYAYVFVCNTILGIFAVWHRFPESDGSANLLPSSHLFVTLSFCTLP